MDRSKEGSLRAWGSESDFFLKTLSEFSIACLAPSALGTRLSGKRIASLVVARAGGCWGMCMDIIIGPLHGGSEKSVGGGFGSWGR